jgi:hypothetical protein
LNEADFRQLATQNFSHVRSLQKDLVETDLHGTGRACGHTPFAGAAPFIVKYHLHLRPLDIQSPGRTYGRAGPALETFLFIAPDIMPDALHLDPDAFQVIDALLKILPVTAQFQYHQAFFSGINDGLEDIEREIEFLDEVDRDRFIHDLLGKPEGQHL